MGNFIFGQLYKKRGSEINYTIYEDMDMEANLPYYANKEIWEPRAVFWTSSTTSEQIDTIRTDEESIGKYGIRYTCESTDATTRDTLESIADQKLTYYKDPRFTPSINIIDNRSNYKMCRLGIRSMQNFIASDLLETVLVRKQK
jgi:hypothetical protein